MVYEEGEGVKTNSRQSVLVRYFIYLFINIYFMTFLLPGQPVPVRAGPLPDVGPGVYLKHGQLRASLAGTLTDQTLAIHRQRPHPPAPNSLILGTVTRLSPLQAVVAISVVDGIPLPPGEEFTGVIRTQDIRATEKDKVKIADCFRGGDVVKGLVVRRRRSLCAPSDHVDPRSPLATHAATTSQPHATISVSSLPPARPVGPYLGPVLSHSHGRPQVSRWNRCRGRRCGVRVQGG